MGTSQDPLDVSLIIATHNRSQSLLETLADAAAQKTGDMRFEILVCDNASTDETRKAVEHFSESSPVPVRYLFTAEKGKSHSLNQGIEAARAEYLVYTDDDTRLPPSWLRTIYDAFLSTGADGVAGPIKPLWIGERPAWLSERLLNQLGMVDHGTRPFFVQDKTKSFIGPNCAYKKSLYLRLGGYALDDFHEDVEWFLRAFRGGARLYYEPSAGVLHKVEAAKTTIPYFEKRMYRHGRDIALGAWQKREAALFGVPLWTVRLWFEIHFQALWAYAKGERETALWHWIRRNLYAGAIAAGIKLWRTKHPRRRVPPKVIPAGENAGVRP